MGNCEPFRAFSCLFVLLWANAGTFGKTGCIFAKPKVENMDKKIELQKALEALNKCISHKKDVDDAFMCSVGSVKLIYGVIGDPNKDFKGGYGISHIIAKRDVEHKKDPKKFELTGLQTVRKLMRSVVYGKISRTVPSKQTVHFEKDGYEAVISQNWYGNNVNWVFTGYKIV